MYHGSAVDGDGLRSVIFFSGCNFRCPFCHNPETFSGSGEELELDAVVKTIERYKTYIKSGGVTLSGGEPFLQAEFCISLTRKLHELGLEVIAETNGSILNEELISELDGVRLDIKHYGGENSEKLREKYGAFIRLCEKRDTAAHLTCVLVPSVNDDERSLRELKAFLQSVGKSEIELLPFKKMCTTKYAQLGIAFPYADVPEATAPDVKKAYAVLDIRN